MYEKKAKMCKYNPEINCSLWKNGERTQLFNSIFYSKYLWICKYQTQRWNVGILIISWITCIKTEKCITRIYTFNIVYSISLLLK